MINYQFNYILFIMAYSFIKNSKYYGRYMSKSFNSTKQITNFSNFYYFSTINSVISGMRINYCLNSLQNGILNSDSIAINSTMTDCSLFKEVFQNLLSMKGIMTQLNFNSVLSICQQWSTLRMNSILNMKTILTEPSSKY